MVAWTRFMISLRHVEVFHAIMVAGSVTGAARILNVSQPAVTAVLKHCESLIKFKLFERAGGRLKPTKEAEALFPNVAAIFGRVEALDGMVRDLAGGALGSLSLAAAFPIANGFLAQAVATFMRSAQASASVCSPTRRHKSSEASLVAKSSLESFTCRSRMPG
jgi:DNA-binding transcriptional LysR family regulator